jgi:hypothetical protein
MCRDSRLHRRAGKHLVDEPRLAGALLLSIAFFLFASAAYAATWTGAGESPLNQVRDWSIPANWSGSAVPPANDSNMFGPVGEGTITLNTDQSAGSMTFGQYNNTVIDPGTGGQLKMTNSPSGFSYIQTQEGTRDIYGVDYFTEGPQFTADLVLSVPLSIDLSTPASNGTNSSLMISGKIVVPEIGPGLAYYGYGTGTSLWITSNNLYASGFPIIISDGGGGAGGSSTGYTMHLADFGRVDKADIFLQSARCSLGLQDNATPLNNFYDNHVYTTNGNIFADRSYQLGDIQDAKINVIQYVERTTVNDTATFGSWPLYNTFGRTNNGYGVRISILDWTTTNPLNHQVTIRVQNGNLTENRGGSRYVSGANRLQEPHNYTYVNMATEIAAVTTLEKDGPGVLAINQVTGLGGVAGRWNNTNLLAMEGVLRLGTPTTPQLVPLGVNVRADSAVGIGWNTSIDLGGFLAPPNTPFPIVPAGGGVPGQNGAVDIDMWGHGALLTVDTNMMNGPYLRVGSSMGGDASFDPQPLATKHASTSATIAPTRFQAAPTYYLGGGGGTLEITSMLNDYFGINSPCSLEMGTTGNLLPGRIALNPSFRNTYHGNTNIFAGTLQLMAQDSVRHTAAVNLGTYDLNITNSLYANPMPGYTWTGPGQLLLDAGRNGTANDWDLYWYHANGATNPLFNVLALNGGVIGWTSDVLIPGVPGAYGTPISSNLNPALISPLVNVLGLGGEYSAGTMITSFSIADSVHFPVLLYKAGKNSTLDLAASALPNTYTGGTIIAGGEIIVNDASQLNAQAGGAGGPIAILNGGRLHIAASPVFRDRNFFVPIKVVTSGTPDTVKNCGSVISVDDGAAASLMANFDFSSSPCAYLEKDGPGSLVYYAPAPVAAGTKNAWGIKLTDGTFQTYQLPVNPGIDTGPVIFNGGNMYVLQVPAGMGTLDADPAYGFRNIVSYPIASVMMTAPAWGFTWQNTVTVFDNAMFRSHGSLPNQILGEVHFVANDADSSPANNVVDLSRNMAPATANPGDFSQGNGLMSFQGVTVYMSGGGPTPPSGSGALSGALNVLPRDAGFTLELQDGVVFNASHQNFIFGNVLFNNSDPAVQIKIDAEEANPTPLIAPPYYQFLMQPDYWGIYGTGLTSWSGKTEKIGAGKIIVNRLAGAPVMVNDGALLQISGGTFMAGGTADPFTDTLSGVSIDIVNNSSAAGLMITQGVKTVGDISGTGTTTVSGPAGTELIVTSIVQNTITLGAGCTLTILAIPGGPSAGGGITPVPEPATWLMLVLAAAGMLMWRARSRK